MLGQEACVAALHVTDRDVSCKNKVKGGRAISTKSVHESIASRRCVAARFIEAHERSETVRVNATRVTCASSRPRSGVGWLRIPPSAARNLYAALAAGELEGTIVGEAPRKLPSNTKFLLLCLPIQRSGAWM